MILIADKRLLLTSVTSLLRRHIMTAAASIGFRPIPCKKGKPRNLEKEVHPRKQMIAEKLKAAVESPYFVFFHYGDMKNTEWNDLRFELSKQNISVTIFPNNISKKVLEGTKYHNLRQLFVSTTATCYSSESNLKALLDVMKSFPKLQLVGGKVDNEILSWNQIIKHSKLPSLDVLQGQLLQLLRQPTSQLSSILCQSQRQLISNLNQYVSQNTAESEDK